MKISTKLSTLALLAGAMMSFTAQAETQENLYDFANNRPTALTSRSPVSATGCVTTTTPGRSGCKQDGQRVVALQPKTALTQPQVTARRHLPSTSCC